jgi:hypothetical protein
MWPVESQLSRPVGVVAFSSNDKRKRPKEPAGGAQASGRTYVSAWLKALMPSRRWERQHTPSRKVPIPTSDVLGNELGIAAGDPGKGGSQSSASRALHLSRRPQRGQAPPAVRLRYPTPGTHH